MKNMNKTILTAIADALHVDDSIIDRCALAALHGTGLHVDDAGHIVDADGEKAFHEFNSTGSEWGLLVADVVNSHLREQVGEVVADAVQDSFDGWDTVGALVGPTTPDHRALALAVESVIAAVREAAEELDD